MNWKTIRRYRAFFMGFILFCAIILLLLKSIPVYASSWNKMPSGTPIPPNTQVIPLNYKAGTTKIEYNTASYPNKFKTIPYSNGTRGLCVKISSQTASYSYRNFCTVIYPKATAIRGRDIDVKLEFTSMNIGPKKGNDYLCSDGYMAFARITPGVGTNVFDSASMASRYDGNRRGYGAKKDLTTKVTIIWSDTGETVKLPFYQGIRDIDATDDYFTEGWYGGNGFSSTFYIWPTCVNAPSGTTMMAAANQSTGGDEEYTKTGLVAPTEGGVWHMTWYGGNCGTGLRIYSQYKDLPAPAKNVDKRSAIKGDLIIWTVSQKVGTFYKNMYSAYSNFSFSDTIPEGVDYQSIKVYNGSAEITSQGSLSYNENIRKLTFTLNSSLLTPQSFYKGQTISMQITATAENPKEVSKTITNQATSVISGETQNTNTVTTIIRRPDLKISKKAERECYRSYEEVTYTVTIWQNTQGLAIDNITVSDALPKQLTLKETPILSGTDGTVTSNDNTWIARIDRLDYGETALITFTGTLEKIRIEKNILNKVTARAEGLPDAVSSAAIRAVPLPLAVHVKKDWQDQDDFYGLRPNSVTVELLQDGNPIQKMILQKSRNWKGVFENLPEYRTETEHYEYTIRETGTPKGYDVSIGQMQQNGEFEQKILITNTLEFYDLTICKQIAKYDDYPPHGDATFLYRVISKEHPNLKWYAEITLNQADAAQSGDKLTASKTLHLPYGQYMVEELNVLRYQGGITKTEGPVTADKTKQFAFVMLHSKGAKASVSYTNEKTRWDRYSHNDLVINRLR